MNKRLFVFISFVFLFSQAGSTVINQMRIGRQANGNRIVLESKTPFKYKVFTIRYPDRLVVDIDDGSLAFDVKRVQIKGSLITKIRSGVRQKKDLRLVFDLAQAVKSKAHVLAAYQGNPNRLVIDLSSKRQVRKQFSVSPQSLQPTVVVPRKIAKLRKTMIVIDPGHGGKDPGAMGPRGTREKIVVLKIAKYLKQYIDKDPNMAARLTRRGDYYVGLRRRLKLARKQNSDVFVAIHADAFIHARSNGASVYALSQRGATSEAARWIANRENNSELGGVDLSDKSQLLRSVLLDLSQTATIGASLQLGSYILPKLSNIARLHSRRVEQARFVVLKSPDIPSVLIETGFISNPKEERNLGSSRYQKKMANAIYRGIKNYLVAHPPNGTWFAINKRRRSYTVARGDNLSGIANKFQVSQSDLKKFNHIRGNQLAVGQVLHIPRRGDV